MTDSTLTLQLRGRDGRMAGAIFVAALGALTSLGLSITTDEATLVPLTISLAAALALVPFPIADRLLAMSLVGTMPLLWSDALPNLPLASAVVIIGLLRIAPVELRHVDRRTWIALAAIWTPIVIGVSLAEWPPIAVWLRPAALLAIGLAAAALGALVWRDPGRRQRWLEGLTIALLVVAAPAIVVFALQFFVPLPALTDGFADLQRLLRGPTAGETFRAQNNWLIPGDPVILRAISPLFPSPNNLGAYLGIVTPVAFAQSLAHPSKRWRVLAFLAAALGVAVVVLTYSRSTWLSAGIAGAVMVVTLVAVGRLGGAGSAIGRRAAKGTAVLALVALVAVGLGAAGASSDVVDRVANPLGDESVTDRLSTNELALEYIREHPLRGAGLGNWRATISDQEDVAYIHNVYLEYSAAAGVLGGLWALLVVTVPLIAGAAWVAGATTTRDLAMGAVATAIFAFSAIHFMFDDNLLNPQYAWLLFFAQGGALSAALAPRPRPKAAAAARAP